MNDLIAINAKLTELSKNYSLLYIEDEHAAREQLGKLLTRYFKKVVCAENGQDGLEKFYSDSFDLIITDIEMPIMGGVDFAKEVRISNANVPIIVLTAYNNPKDLVNLIDIGIDKYIIKPVNFEKLAGSICNVLVNLQNAKKALQYEELLLKQLVNAQDELDRALMYDPITNLPNHTALHKLLETGESKLHTIIAIKIHNYKSIREVLGEDFASHYASELSAMIFQYVEFTDGYLGLHRTYVDELVLVFEGASPFYKKLAQEFLAISKYFFVTHDEISIGSPLTIVLFSDSSELYAKTLSSLLYAYEHFKGELYVVDNENNVCFGNKHSNNIYWLTQFSDAIENEQIQPFFQPIFNNKTEQVEKFECLARMLVNDEIISPDKFVTLAASAKQTPFLTRSMARKAFEYFADKPQFEFSINVSAMDLQDDELLRLVTYWQNKTKIDPSRVVLEILESEDIYKYGIFQKAIAGFKERGFKIAIDDFGTGYSNFITLFEYNVDFIKIDGSFIKNLDTDEHMYKVVSHLDKLIKMCGAKSIGEFVRNDKIQNIIKEIGVDYSQGYHIGAPKPNVDDFL
jgi:EAL domain-containing protein (putative c-di-GMP-specific phosphodiesterase class I)/DNA-binding response OmpR family regulator